MQEVEVVPLILLQLELAKMVVVLVGDMDILLDLPEQPILVGAAVAGLLLMLGRLVAKAVAV